MANGTDSKLSEDNSSAFEEHKLTCPRCNAETNMLWNVDIEYTCSTKRRRVCKKCRDELLEEIKEVLNNEDNLKNEIKDKEIVKDITCPGCGEGDTCPCVLHSISVTKELEGKKIKKDNKDFIIFKKADFDLFKKSLFGG